MISLFASGGYIQVARKIAAHVPGGLDASVRLHTAPTLLIAVLEPSRLVNSRPFSGHLAACHTAEPGNRGGPRSESRVHCICHLWKEGLSTRPAGVRTPLANDAPALSASGPRCDQDRPTTSNRPHSPGTPLSG